MSFVKSVGGNFTLAGARFRFIGVNHYPLVISYNSQSYIQSFFAACEALGINVVRTWAFDTVGSRSLQYPIGTNLLANGDFETNTTGWTLGGDFTRSNDTAESGSYSIKQVSAGGYSSLDSTAVTVVANTNYVLTFWHKTSNIGGFSDVVFVGTSPGANDIKDGGFISDTAGLWVQQQVLFNSGANTSLYIHFGNFSGTVNAYFDKISVSIPGTPFLVQNESQYKQLDLVLNEASKHGVRVILSLMDGNENNYNSKSQYVQWANAIYGDSFSNTYPYLDFFTSADCQAIYKSFVDTLPNRVNTISGIVYKNDPTIFSYELGNELRTNNYDPGDVVNTLDAPNLTVLSKSHTTSIGSITNSSFETDTSGWVVGTAFTRSNADAEDGSWSMYQNSASFTYDSIVYAVDVTPNTNYTFSAYYKLTNTPAPGDPSQNPTRMIVGTSGGQNDIADGGYFSNTATWQQKSMVFNSGANTKIYLSIQNWGGTNVGYFDNITLTPQQNYNGWADIMSTYIKSVDPNHMVGFGDMAHGWQWVQGDTIFNGTFYGVDYGLLSALPNLDYADYHTYPDQGDNVHLQEYGQKLGYPDAVSGDGYRAQLRDFVTVAKANGKPAIIGEVGFVRETIGDTTYFPLYPRSAAFHDIMDTFLDAGGDGVILWHGEVNDGGSYSINLSVWNGDTTNLNYNDTPLQGIIVEELRENILPTSLPSSNPPSSPFIPTTKDSSTPSFAYITEGAQINITIPQTEAILTDQGYTYNQAGLTYNQVGIQYGGVTNSNEDLSPVFAILAEVPHLAGIYDRYTQKPPSPTGNSGMLIGILGLTYP